MKIDEVEIPTFVKEKYKQFPSLTPIQEKAIVGGLLEDKSQLICAPTASGKTLVATMAISKALEKQKKALYIVPLKALANEKFKEYLSLLENTEFKVTKAVGDIDSPSLYLGHYDIIVLTTEKLDSLLRHKVQWLHEVSCVVIDEIHLLNDPSRGPTLEIILTLLKTLIKPQIVGLSATIGNPQELANWLEADLIKDDWRPVELKQGILVGKKVQFY
ncbi:DEAD/DEAH box helicase [Candidatus Woesearchaeota archaeon]|nr:DEAD/DEAH box helicase [Candidatus Woesearchaeota archaeon]